MLYEVITGWRFHPYPPAGGPAEDLPAVGDRRGGGRGEVRLSPECPEIRLSAPWRVGLRSRPAGHAADGIELDPRRYGLPQDSDVV